MFVPTRAEGLHRLSAFLPAAGRHYADNRNTDGGPEARGNVSLLSPYLRYRLLMQDKVIAAALSQHGSNAAGKFVQEVAWRTFWKGWLELRPTVWRRFLAEPDATRGSDAIRAVAQAEAGATGIQGFDERILRSGSTCQRKYRSASGRPHYGGMAVLGCPTALRRHADA